MLQQSNAPVFEAYRLPVNNICAKIDAISLLDRSLLRKTRLNRNALGFFRGKNSNQPAVRNREKHNNELKKM